MIERGNYSYVGGNPLSYKDQQGLATQADINLAVSLIMRANSWSYPTAPNSVTMVSGLSKWFGSPVHGATDFSGNIELRAELYGDSNAPVDSMVAQEFLQTMAHEMYHDNQGLAEQIMSKPPNEIHRSVDHAAEILAESLAREFESHRGPPCP